LSIHAFRPLLDTDQPSGSHQSGQFPGAVPAPVKLFGGSNSHFSSSSSNSHGFNFSVTPSHGMPRSLGQTGSRPFSSLVPAESRPTMQDGYTHLMQPGSHERLLGSEEAWNEMILGIDFTTSGDFGT
jgi:hypothetical protein